METRVGPVTSTLLVASIIGTTWCLAYARSMSDRADKGYWAPDDPELARHAVKVSEDADRLETFDTGHLAAPATEDDAPAAVDLDPLADTSR